MPTVTIRLTRSGVLAVALVSVTTGNLTYEAKVQAHTERQALALALDEANRIRASALEAA